MKTLLLRIRAALGIGAIWAGVGGVIGSAIGGVAGLFVGEFGYLFAMGGLGAGAMGFVLGTGFATALSTLNRDRSLEELTPRRAGFIGFVVGACVPLLGIAVSTALVGSAVPIVRLLPVLLGAAGSYGALTAGLAAGTVALAKRAPSVLDEGTGADGLQGVGPDPAVPLLHGTQP